MSSIVVSPINTDWRVGAEEFARRLRERWPQVEIRSEGEDNSGICLSFKVAMDNSVVEGGLGRMGQALFIDYGLDIGDIVGLAVWYRSWVPPTVEMAICHEGGGGYMLLRAGVTKEEALRAFSSAQS